jgi:hypothetical protein
MIRKLSNLIVLIKLVKMNSGFESLHNLMVNKVNAMKVNNTIQVPWGHSDCLIAAESGTNLTGLIPENTSLIGNMKVQSGIISAILPNGCSISQTINGYMSFFSILLFLPFFNSLVIGQNYYLSFYYIQVGTTSSTFNINGNQFIVCILGSLIIETSF